MGQASLMRLDQQRGLTHLIDSVEPRSSFSLGRWKSRVSERLAYVRFCRTFSPDVLRSHSSRRRVWGGASKEVSHPQPRRKKS